jgi:hypothetical protein
MKRIKQMFKILAIAIVAGLTTASAPVTIVHGHDYDMTVTTECAQVIINSGYTSAIDVHRKLTGTPEYIAACF